MGWDNNDVMNILNSQTVQREKFFIEKECEEDKECLTTNKETPNESSTISDKSTTTSTD